MPVFYLGGAFIAHFNPNDRRRPNKKVEPINENIHYPEVMVIGPDGQNLGRMSSNQANALAIDYDLDLFCVSPSSNPPVCKILNYGKYRYEQQKAQRSQKKNAKGNELKEIQLHISIGSHDLNTKGKAAKGFLEDGNRINIRVILKGREMAHKELGEETMKRFLALLEEEIPLVVVKENSWEGKCYSGIYAKKK